MVTIRIRKFKKITNKFDIAKFRKANEKRQRIRKEVIKDNEKTFTHKCETQIIHLQPDKTIAYVRPHNQSLRNLDQPVSIFFLSHTIDFSNPASEQKKV